ncbi:MAG: DNA translocase FtsK [Phycisphaerales bacterium]|nr:DNA translocase FtsK [Phycisphaerales bacterium]MBT7170164.1 DNA translocase FtsK [Phycisphaerales bacterium]
MSKDAKTKSSSQRDHQFWRVCGVLGALGIILLCWISLLSYSPDDPGQYALGRHVSASGQVIVNQGGKIGAYLADALRYWLGIGAYGLLAVGTLWTALALCGRQIGHWPWRLAGIVFFGAALSAMGYMADPQHHQTVEIVQGQAGVMGEWLGVILGSFGTYSWVVTSIVLIGGVLLAAEEAVVWTGKQLRGHHEKFQQAREERKALQTEEQPEPVRRRKAPTIAQPVVAENEPFDLPKKKKRLLGFLRGENPPVEPEPEIETEDPKEAKRQARADAKAARAAAKAEAKATKAAAVVPAAKPTSKAPAKPKAVAKPKTTAKSKAGGAVLPDLKMLERGTNRFSAIAEKQAQQRMQVLQQTLEDYGVDAEVVGYETGPVITLFELQLAPGVKTAAVTNLSTDIARTLAVPSVRVVPARSGRDTVGVEVPNLEKEIVRLHELIAENQKKQKSMRLPMFLGKDAGGSAIVMDLAKAPHMLIAGTTGSGKSVCINTIIMSLLMTRTKQDVRFILVDPKMVEMAAFERLPHLLCPTITDMKKAEAILEWACQKMDDRYELLREARVKNIDDYNKVGAKMLYERFNADTDEEKEKVPLTIPSYVIIIDELADLMMTNGKEVESFIIRIAQKARAVGIHLVLATQRPSANVVTGLIRSNMPCRISFRVASGMESRIVLDQKGGEVLLGKGDMLVLQPGEYIPDRAQGTWIPDDEIHRVVDYLQTSGEQEFDPQLLKLDEPGGGGDADGGLFAKDELFDQAVNVVLTNRRGSVSLLQRKMAIGYGRASRLIDQMGEAGILGPHKGSQARECLMTLDDWKQLQGDIARDQSSGMSY